MKFTVLSVFVVLYTSAANADCTPPAMEDITQQRSFSNAHTLFVRCHPTKNLIFSNEFGRENRMVPVAINMDTGAHTILKTPENHSAMDPAPSLSGRTLYVHMFGPEGANLGVYTITKTGEAKYSGLVKGEGFINYDYPSPLFREEEEQVLYRTDKGLYLSKIENTDTVPKATVRQKICANIFGESDVSLPYISGDGAYLGALYENEMTIFELDWSNATASEVPCKIKRRMPGVHSKLSFSADNSRVAFEAGDLEGLGKKAEVSQGFDSYVMDIKTGNIMPVTSVKEDEHSDFPAFCGKNKVITRVVKSGEMVNTRYRLIKGPNSSEISKFANGCNPTATGRNSKIGRQAR